MLTHNPDNNLVGQEPKKEVQTVKEFLNSNGYNKDNTPKFATLCKVKELYFLIKRGGEYLLLNESQYYLHLLGTL